MSKCVTVLLDKVDGGALFNSKNKIDYTKLQKNFGIPEIRVKLIFVQTNGNSFSLES